jgi:L-fuconolactonase
MTIIDSQVRAYEANTPKRPWHSVPNWPDHVTGDEMVAAMDKVGVDGAIFISAFSMYRCDASYAVEVQRAHPGTIRGRGITGGGPTRAPCSSNV